jgi:hypothetical protein
MSGVGVSVIVEVNVGVAVAVMVGVAVGGSVGVLVGVTVGSGWVGAAQAETNPKANDRAANEKKRRRPLLRNRSAMAQARRSGWAGCGVGE